MSDLVEFLRARLDEREHLAREAAEQTAESWRSYFKQVVAPTSRYGEDPAEANSSEVAAHVAYHDPDRVLRDVEAKRRIIEAHPITTQVVGYGSGKQGFGCQTCHDWDGATEGHGYCDTLKALALPDADLPEYQEEWRP